MVPKARARRVDADVDAVVAVNGADATRMVAASRTPVQLRPQALA